MIIICKKGGTGSDHRQGDLGSILLADSDGPISDMPGNQARSDWTDQATHAFDRFLTDLKIPPSSWNMGEVMDLA